ncbi:MAG TPA: metallophosphoesterase [Burkholderiaceae bacterium]
MQKIILPLMISAALLAVATTATAGNTPFDTNSQGVKTVAVFGDAPYGTSPTDTSEFMATPSFIDSINADPDVSLVLHVGDIHSGSQFCTEAYNRSVYDLWARFQHPLVYTPGDNEWADCHKAKEGGGTYNASTGQIDYKRDADGNLIDYMGGNPVANLDLVRSIFFTNSGYSLGAHKLVQSQFQAFDRTYPSDQKYIENVMWEQSKVLFVTINIPGGSNNDSDIWYGAPTISAEQAQERSERTAADLRWLDAAFARAVADDAHALVIQTQADMWDLDGKTASHLVQYKPFIESIAAHTAAFGKPVILFNGDSHVYRSDNPLVAGAPCVIESSVGAPEVACSNDAYTSQPNGYHVPNFHRVVVHGSTFPLEWLKLRINPRANAINGANAFGPFSWQRMIPQ